MLVYDEDPPPGLRYDPEGIWGGGATVQGNRVQSYCPQVWNQYYGRSEFSGYYHGYNVAFLHERTNGDRSHLVAALYRFENVGERSGIDVFGRSTPNFVRPHRPAFHIALKPTDRLRIYAGQPDLADASHFTIRYEINHIAGTIDGWLQPDDTVKLQVRDGPALASSQPAASRAPTSHPSDR